MSKGQGAGGREQKANAIDAQRTKNAERCTRMAWSKERNGHGVKRGKAIPHSVLKFMRSLSGTRFLVVPARRRVFQLQGVR